MTGSGSSVLVMSQGEASDGHVGEDPLRDASSIESMSPSEREFANVRKLGGGT